MGCKWVFTVKKKSDGQLRGINKLLTQSGIQYQETFAHVAKMNPIHALLSHGANLSWPIQLLDVKNAFLYRDLEEVYIDFPQGFSSHATEGRRCVD